MRDCFLYSYRFGFNEQEKDDEWDNVTGSKLDFGARVYDARIGRWLSLDPLMKKYTSWSPYNFTLNNPIFLVDEDGRDVVKSRNFKKKNDTQFKVFTKTDAAKSTLNRFASANSGDYTSEVDGILSRHTLEFKHKGQAQNGGEAETKLYINTTNGWKEFDLEKHGGLITKETKFKVSVNLQIPGKSDKDIGYGAAMLNHENILWVSDIANSLEKFENGDINAKELGQELRYQQTKKYIDNKYLEVEDENSVINKTQDELINKTSDKVRKGVEEFKEEDKNSSRNRRIYE